MKHRHYYTYDIVVRNGDIPEGMLTKEEKELGYIPTYLESEVNRIYSGDEKVVSMTITPIIPAGEVFATGYHIVYVTKD